MVEYLKIEKIYPVKLLIDYLSINNGQKIKFEEISTISGLSQKAVKHYLEILEETFLIKRIRPFFTNKNKEIIKIPKIYFLDTGVVNYFINNFNPLELRKDTGFLLENFIISEVTKNLNLRTELKFWTDKNQREVDLILESPSYLAALEIKYKNRIKDTDTSGLRAFENMYSHKDPLLLLINLGEQLHKKNIHFKLPFGIFDFLHHEKKLF